MSRSRPNVLVVFPDQMRGSCLGLLGEEPVRTPHLDAFANQATVFTSAVSNCPVCSPWRAMFLTGQWPARNTVTGNCHSRSPVELPTAAVCWSDVIAGLGYHCGWIGKWHLDRPEPPFVNCLNNHGEPAWNEWCPPERRHGFRHWYAYGTYDYHLRPMYWQTDAPRDGFHFVDQWGPEHEADKAIAFIQDAAEGQARGGPPFALVVSMNPPHTPYEAVPDRYLELYRHLEGETLVEGGAQVPPSGTRWGDHARRVLPQYYAAVSGVDEQFGRIIRALDDAGMAENTLVVFTSDHGDCLGSHGVESKPAPYEEAVRIPLLMRWPGRITPRRDELLLSTPDLAPSLLGLLGLGERIPDCMQGTDFSLRIRSGVGEGPEGQLLMGARTANLAQGWRAWRSRQHTLVIGDKESAWDCALYDRSEDPRQVHNIALERPDLVRCLADCLRGEQHRQRDDWEGVLIA